MVKPPNRRVNEKRRPTYRLDDVKAAFTGTERVMTGPLKDAFALGFTGSDIVATIQTIQRTHFDKSMTSHADHTVWQDVYHVPSPVGVLYIKFMMIDGLLWLMSFKEKDSD
jgi:motility quorum-sensing regulator/GCU-specific mRNA interferase toxin